MQSYCRIETEERYAATIWQKEQSAPEWFRTAGNVWTPTFESYLVFWRRCGQIWGLFDDETFLACVYLEFLRPDAVNIHVSVIESVSPKHLARFFTSLKCHQRNEGVNHFYGWVLDKNRHLLAIAEQSGFERSGLRMRYGAVRGRILNWIEIRA